MIKRYALFYTKKLDLYTTIKSLFYYFCERSQSSHAQSSSCSSIVKYYNKKHFKMYFVRTNYIL